MARRGSSSPHPWSPAYAYSKCGEVVAPKRGKLYRDVAGKQPKCPEVVSCTEQQAKGGLGAWGFAPALPPKVNRHCWHCQRPMALKTRQDGRQVLPHVCIKVSAVV